jgi:ABC-2 type transport system ATP-binding protein
MPDWMRVRELIRYTRAFHPRWDDSLASELLGMFKLDPEARIHSLSRGQRAKAGLLAALAHRPDFLVLDEPSAGLDPAVRRHILWAVVRTAADEGRTVLFSSHLLDEVERVADNVAMLHDGTVAMSGPIDGIRERHRQFTLHFETPVDHAPAVDGALSCWGHGKEWNVVCDGESEPVRQAAARLGARVVEECAPSLEDIFIARTQPGLFAASGKEA